MSSVVLQLGHPKIIRESFPAFETVRDVFLHLFRAEEESIYLFWHQIPLRFRYRKELHRNFDQILAMVWLVQRDSGGATEVNFTTQLLTTSWEVYWDENEVHIQSTFTACEKKYADYAQGLNQWPEVKMAKEAFLSEWKTLLHQIIVAFRAGKVTIRDGTERRKWEMLQRVDQQIDGYGQLYTSER